MSRSATCRYRKAALSSWCRPRTSSALTWRNVRISPWRSIAATLTFEQLNQGYGYVLYSTHFNQPLKGRLEIPGLRDYATVYVDGERVGELNRCFNQYAMEIDIPFNATLDILVENMGRMAEQRRE